MLRTSYVVAWLSLALGVGLLLTAVVRHSSAFSVGTVLGVLLIANGLVRVWVLRGGRARQ